MSDPETSDRIPVRDRRTATRMAEADAAAARVPQWFRDMYAQAAPMILQEADEAAGTSLPPHTDIDDGFDCPRCQALAASRGFELRSADDERGD